MTKRTSKSNTVAKSYAQLLNEGIPHKGGLAQLAEAEKMLDPPPQLAGLSLRQTPEQVAFSGLGVPAGQFTTKQERDDWLDRLSLVTMLDKEFGLALCARVAGIARDNKRLSAAIRSSLKRSKRPNLWPTWRYHVLLTHYANYLMESNGDHTGALALLGDYERRMTGSVLSPRTLDNRISKALRIIDPRELPDWATAILQNRRQRGASTRQ